MKYIPILIVCGLLLMPVAIADAHDSDEQQQGFFSRLRSWLTGETDAPAPQQIDEPADGRPDSSDERPSDVVPDEQGNTGYYGRDPGFPAEGVPGSSGGSVPVDSGVIYPDRPRQDYCVAEYAVICKDVRGEFLCNGPAEKCKDKFGECRIVKSRMAYSECRVDSDCPVINCIRAPCPQNVCSDGRCVLEEPSTCGNGICEDGEKPYCPDYTCPDGQDECPMIGMPCYRGCPEDCGQAEPPSEGCFYNGEWYKPGASFKSTDGCNTCHCGENGNVGCTEMACLGPDDSDDSDRFCCRAMTATCLSCSEGVSVKEYCEKYPSTDGC